ncbi:MAG: protein kinase [Planctomycetes bacterium]|nr:protein kinase [Planctomycetota bacterium]
MTSAGGGTFGSYRLLERLGEGGMGVVYVAEDLRLGRRVALKRIKADGLFGGPAADPRFHARFEEEVRAASRLDHPGIVKVYEVGEVDGQPYFTMELVAGRPLDDLMKSEPVPPMAAARLALGLVRALDYAHGQGVVHRDVKPSNVLVDDGYNPHLLDFGLAKRLDEERGLTRTGAILGTPQYLAPEQVDPGFGAVGPATDVYGAGAVLYECLTREPPNRGQSEVEIYYHLINEEVVPPRKINPAVPPKLSAVCRRALEKDPRRRYPTSREFADDLQRLLLGWQVEAGGGGLARAVLGNSRRLAAALAALLAVAVGSAWLWNVGGRTRSELESSAGELRAGLARAANRGDWPAAREAALELEALGQVNPEDRPFVEEAALHAREEREARANRLLEEARDAVLRGELDRALSLARLAAEAGPLEEGAATQVRSGVEAASRRFDLGGEARTEEDLAKDTSLHAVRGWYYRPEELPGIGFVQLVDRWDDRRSVEADPELVVIGDEAVSAEEASARGREEFEGGWVERQLLADAGYVEGAGGEADPGQQTWRPAEDLLREGFCEVPGHGWMTREAARTKGLLVESSGGWWTEAELAEKGFVQVSEGWRHWKELLGLGLAAPEGAVGEFATPCRFRFREGKVEWVDSAAGKAIDLTAD